MDEGAPTSSCSRKVHLHFILDAESVTGMAWVILAQSTLLSLASSARARRQMSFPVASLRWAVAASQTSSTLPLNRPLILLLLPPSTTLDGSNTAAQDSSSTSGGLKRIPIEQGKLGFESSAGGIRRWRRLGGGQEGRRQITNRASLALELFPAPLAMAGSMKA